MKDPASGPFLFDTSAEVWLTRHSDSASREWFQEYTTHHPVHVSAVSVIERIRGYALLWRRYPPLQRRAIEAARVEYLNRLGTVCPLTTEIAIVTAEIMALLPQPPATRRRSHKL